VSCTSRSRTNPRLRRRRNNSAKRSRGPRRHDTWSTIVIQPSTRGQRRRRRSASRKFSRLHGHRGRTRTRSGWSDRFAANASTTSSSGTRGLRRVLNAYVAYYSIYPDAPLAQQRCADLATGRVTDRGPHRRDSTSRQPPPSVRTPRRVRQTAVESTPDASPDFERRDAHVASCC
jgi:hypothetical protein